MNNQLPQLPVIVSGANGFTGKFVCKELIKNKINFIALLRLVVFQIGLIKIKSNFDSQI